MKTVIILQGVPGSGKTSFASERIAASHAQVKVVSADHFFERIGGGKYAFDPMRLSEAHGECFREFIAALQGGVEMVIVDNTNTRVEEISPYVLGAQAYGYEFEVLRVLCDPKVAAARNQHGVPEGAVRAMADRIAKCNLPPWWRRVDFEAA
jgi:tRNA uridine 5-carbamoylmethylation protein Kti12